MNKKILLLIGVALLFFYIGRNSDKISTQNNQSSTVAQASTTPNTPLKPSHTNQSNAILRAFEQQQSDIPVQGTGQIIKELADDNNGSRHQRILLKLPEGLTILIAHNIDLAPRVDNIQAGDAIEFKGEYAWNAKGGVVHWTHHDPNGRHPDGWLKHQNRTYQ